MKKPSTHKGASIIVSLLILLLSGNGFSLDYEPDLCNENEHVAFSCATGDKVISVCSSMLSHIEPWYLAYRFGNTNEEYEIEYKFHAQDFHQKKISYSYSSYKEGEYGQPNYDSGDTQELSFTIDEYQYTLHIDQHRSFKSGAGTFVLHNNEVETYHHCNNTHSRLDSYYYRLYDLKDDGFIVETPSYIGVENKD